MSNERIINIPTTITRMRAGEMMETDNTSPGSAQIAVADITAGQLVDFGVATLPNSDNPTINFNSTLSAPPTSFELTFMAPGGGGAGNNVIGGVADLSSVSTTQFNLLLMGAPGDTTHKVKWKAFA